MVLLAIFALKTKNMYPDGAVSLEEIQQGFSLDTGLDLPCLNYSHLHFLCKSIWQNELTVELFAFNQWLQIMHIKSFFKLIIMNLTQEIWTWE